MTHFVLGAGPAGLAAADALVRAGEPVAVLEAAPVVGGMARSFDFEGHRVDLGPHRFAASDPRVLALWREVLGEDVVLLERLTRIRYRDRHFHYPLRAGDVLRGLGPGRAAAAILSYLRARLVPHPDPAGFEGWVVGAFGRVLYETFFRSYTEKLWGIPCAELSADWAAHRIQGLSLGAAIRRALVGGAGPRSWIERFEYPRVGNGELYRRLAARVEGGGGELRLATRVTGVEHDGDGRVTAVRWGGPDGTEGRRELDGWVVSSIPLTLLVEALDPPAPPSVRAAAAALRFRHTVLVYLLVEGTALFPDHWMYVHAPEVRTGRITNYRNWSPDLLPPGSIATPLSAEYWCSDGDALWEAPEDDLVALATRELDQLGLISAAAVRAARVVRVPRCYPVYARGYRAHVDALHGYLASFENLEAVGRYGTFRYNNQDLSLLMGLEAAERVAAGRRAPAPPPAG